jgi:hypothetical protein
MVVLGRFSSLSNDGAGLLGISLGGINLTRLGATRSGYSVLHKGDLSKLVGLDTH